VTINGTPIVNLNNSVARPQTFSASFSITVLKNGTNTLNVSSVASCGAGMVGYDDFEISNINIRLSN
jgi:hypothetical protein